MASCLFWGNWILQLCRKSNWIALMWWLITSLDYYAKLTAVSGLGNKWEALSLLLTCARHFYANVNGFYKSHDFPVKNEKFWRKKKKKWLLKVVRMLGVWTQEFHFSHVSCRFTFARPAYLDSISELLDSCLSSSTSPAEIDISVTKLIGFDTFANFYLDSISELLDSCLLSRSTIYRNWRNGEMFSNVHWEWERK